MDAGDRSTEVWAVDLDRCGSRLVEVARGHRLLTEDENRRADAIADPAARNGWIAAHATLHLVLRKRIGRPVQFAPSPANTIAKPRIAGWDGDFSLAHSGRLALIAVAGHGCVGVDVEARRAVQIDARRRQLIEAAGAAVAMGSPRTDRDEQMRFLAAWARLEAVAKALGSGIGAVLETIGLHAPDANATSAAVEARRLISGETTLTIHDIDLTRFDAVAALAQSSSGATPVIRKLPADPGAFAR